MGSDALGLIETVGLAAAVEAADTCMKAANVKLIGYELTKGFGMVTVKISGDVSAVQAAINSAKIQAATVNTVYAALVIPRPAAKLEIMIESSEVVGLASELKEESVCNLCSDPKCKRKKGMRKKLCLHFKDCEGGVI